MEPQFFYIRLHGINEANINQQFVLYFLKVGNRDQLCLNFFIFHCLQVKFVKIPPFEVINIKYSGDLPVSKNSNVVILYLRCHFMGKHKLVCHGTNVSIFIQYFLLLINFFV